MPRRCTTMCTRFERADRVSRMTHDFRHIPTYDAIASRFRHYMSLVRKSHPNVTVSRLAESLGYEDASFLDSICAGNQYHSWRAINDFCVRARVCPEWLKHGERAPFAPNSACSSDEMRLLSQLDRHPASTLYLVRSDCDFGYLCFVIKSDEFVWEVFKTDVNISSRNGATGGHRLVTLYRLISALKARPHLHAYGHTLPRPKFLELVHGEVFPAAYLWLQPTCYWSDDFTDLRGCHTIHGEEFLAAQSIVSSGLQADKARRDLTAAG